MSSHGGCAGLLAVALVIHLPGPVLARAADVGLNDRSVDTQQDSRGHRDHSSQNDRTPLYHPGARAVYQYDAPPAAPAYELGSGLENHEEDAWSGLFHYDRNENEAGRTFNYDGDRSGVNYYGGANAGQPYRYGRGKIDASRGEMGGGSRSQGTREKADRYSSAYTWDRTADGYGDSGWRTHTDRSYGFRTYRDDRNRYYYDWRGQASDTSPWSAGDRSTYLRTDWR